MSEIINILNQEELDQIINGDYKVDYPGLKEAMESSIFTINELNVTARDATYWDKKGILPELKGKQSTRRKYTLKQAVWIKLIQQLRTFDISLSKIKIIKDNLLKTNLNVREIIESGGIDFVLEKLASKEGKLEEFKTLIKDPTFLKEMENEAVDVFELMIYYTIVFRRDVSYIATAKGECLPYIFDKHNELCKEVPEFELFMKSPHIILSITQAYCQLIQDWTEKKWFNEISIISKDEKKILQLIRDNDIKEIRVMKMENEVDRIICTKNISIENIEEFANHIVKNGYQTMTLITRQGKPVHFKNEVSLKLKNIPE